MLDSLPLLGRNNYASLRALQRQQRLFAAFRRLLGFVLQLGTSSLQLGSLLLVFCKVSGGLLQLCRYCWLLAAVALGQLSSNGLHLQ